MEKLVSLLIYATTYAITLGVFKITICKSEKKSKIIWIFFSALIPSALAGLRFETGRDYYSYITNFDMIASGFNSRLEIGFKYLNKLIAWLGLSAQFMLFIVALIMMFFICSALFRKKDTIPVVMGLCTFLLLFYQSSYNVIRLMLAVSISLYNIKNIENKKIFKFTFFVVLAGLFHTTAFVMIPLYFVYNHIIHQKGTWKKILLYIVTIFIILNFNIIVEKIIGSVGISELDYYMQYTSDGGMLSMEALQQAIFYVPLILIILSKYSECKKIDKNFHIYFSLTIVGTIIIVLSIFLQNYVYRLADYFLIYNVFVIPIYYKVIKTKRLYFNVVFLFGFILLFWIFWYFIIGAHGTSHYHWIY